MHCISVFNIEHSIDIQDGPKNGLLLETVFVTSVYVDTE